MIEVFYATDSRFTDYDSRLGPCQYGAGPYATAAEAEAAVLRIIPDAVPAATSYDAESAVQGWLAAAAEAGDDAMVATCRLVLDGDRGTALVAWCKCEQMADSSYAL